MEAAVEEWIYRRPLKYLPRVVRPGMAEVLSGLGARGLQVGVFSDYPVADKLEAMGLRAAVSLELDATAESDQRLQAASARAGGGVRALGAVAR